MAFYNRNKEIRLLDEVYRRKNAQFLALYGRRRIGKTALWMAYKSLPNWRNDLLGLFDILISEKMSKNQN